MSQPIAKSSISIEWHGSGRQAQCPPNTDYPHGVDIDLTRGATGCLVHLPYPAREIGNWKVDCAACGVRAGISAAGRPDDPRSIRIPCRNRGVAQ